MGVGHEETHLLNVQGDGGACDDDEGGGGAEEGPREERRRRRPELAWGLPVDGVAPSVREAPRPGEPVPACALAAHAGRAHCSAAAARAEARGPAPLLPLTLGMSTVVMSPMGVPQYCVRGQVEGKVARGKREEAVSVR